MSDQPPVQRPNRQARRAVKRPGNPSNPAMESLRRLELLVRGPLRAIMTTAAESKADVSTHVLCVITPDSPFDKTLPPEQKLRPGQVHVRFIERSVLAQAVGGQYGEQINRPHPCGHWWVLLSLRSTSRFCCTRCDMKIEEEAS